MKKDVLILIIISIFSCQLVSADHPPVDIHYYPAPIYQQNISDFYLETINFTPDYSNITIEKEIIPSFNQFKTITFAELLISKNSSKVIHTTFILQINEFEHNVTKEGGDLLKNTYIPFQMDVEGKMIFRSPMRLKLTIITKFMPSTNPNPFYNAYQDINIRFINILTVDRPPAPIDHRFYTPLIMIPSQINTGESSQYFIPFTTEIYIILPKNLNTTHYLNTTITSTEQLSFQCLLMDCRQKIDKLQMINSVSNSDSNVNIFSYKVTSDLKQDESVSKFTLQYSNSKIGTTINLEGFWFTIKNDPNAFDPTEYDSPLLITCTLVPLLFLVKLTYNNRRFKWKNNETSD
ncbi:MAG: hypothetical protein ACXAC7_10620 [Candidatus Hodarchaeales archaeon]